MVNVSLIKVITVLFYKLLSVFTQQKTYQETFKFDSLAGALKLILGLADVKGFARLQSPLHLFRNVLLQLFDSLVKFLACGLLKMIRQIRE